jgi:hypothetical protein
MRIMVTGGGAKSIARRKIIQRTEEGGERMRRRDAGRGKG